jgi:hypothetical protein
MIPGLASGREESKNNSMNNFELNDIEGTTTSITHPFR